MSKKCINCGRELPEDASFCPHCTAVQTEKKKVKMPIRWQKKALIFAAVLVLAAAVGAGLALHHSPKTYEGGAHVLYSDADGSYKVLLNFSSEEGMTGHALGEKTASLAEGAESDFPCQLYVMDQNTGEILGESFTEKVESCKVDTKPSEGSQKLEYAEPVYNEDFPYATYVSDLHYTAYSGSNDIVWTLQMKNGDTITLSTQLTVEKLEPVSYDAKDTPLETAEELNVLLETIEKEVPADIPVKLYLPAVTYDGDITFGDHTWEIYGSTEGDRQTTFTGTVSVNGLDGNYAEISGIRFDGDAGIGLDAYCFIEITECSFEGWDTAVYSQDGSWITAVSCTFTGNNTALKFDTTYAYGSGPDYVNNTFTENKTAVCIESLPGEEILDFSGSVFSGNGTDIENPADHPVNTANATFE